MGVLRALTADDGRDTTRLEAFSDGVIAIAITLLVLEIHVPGLEETEDGSSLWSHLGDLWPSYVGYVVSFAIIGIMWANHHNLFTMIVRSTHYLLLINLLLLICICFVPFTTALLAEHLRHDGERTAVIVYSGWFFFTALVFNALWRYVCWAPGVLDPNADPTTIATITRRYNYGPPSYALAFAAAFVYPPASIAIIIALALLYVLPQ